MQSAAGHCGMLLCYSVTAFTVLQCNRVVGSQSEGNNPENGDATATDTVLGPAHLGVPFDFSFFLSEKSPTLDPIGFFVSLSQNSPSHKIFLKSEILHDLSELLQSLMILFLVFKLTLFCKLLSTPNPKKN